MNSGIYILSIKLEKNVILDIGKLGKFTFPEGYYIYTGSAKKNLSSRIERHKRKNNKKLRWHIDYLLNCEYAHIENVFTFENSKLDECSLNKEILKLNGSEIVVKGFGSSDCKKGCPAHLIFVNNKNSFTFFLKRTYFL